jgi:hypothetical protein
MENFDTEKLIERIEEAKNWLDKAETEYSNSNPIRGGLILNLAQAEVKHAWELSNRQFVSENAPQVKPDYKFYKFEHVIPVAACLVLLTGLVIGARVAGVFSTTVKSKTPSIAGTKAGVSKTLPSVAVETPPNPVAAVAPETLEVTAVTSPSDKLPDNKLPEDAGKKTDSLRSSHSLAEHSGTNIIQDKPAIKAVSNLSIDEEALTKEASRSLRVGK